MLLIIKKKKETSRWPAFSFGEGGKKCFRRSNALELEEKKKKTKKADLNSFQKIGSKFNESHSVTIID